MCGAGQGLLAQTPVSTKINANPICMIRSSSDGAKLSILLPGSDAATLKAKGFTTVPCAESFKSQADRETFRDTICEIASTWREDLQSHFERERGERPAVLCGMAEMVVGQWKRGAK